MRISWLVLSFFSTALRSAAVVERHGIVGGGTATPGEFPFYAAARSGCGGTLIHEDIVLTAAHCLVGGGNTFADGVQIGGTIRPGALAEDPTLQDAMEERRECAATLLPPGYNHSVIGVDDIALVKLTRPSGKRTISVNFDASVPVAGDVVTAIGYGAFGYHRVPGALSEPLYPTYLQVLFPMTIQSEEACRAGERLFGHYHPDYLVCIDDDDPVTTDCRADSGGPIFVTTTQGNGIDFLQVGLLVYGPNAPRTGECRGDRPSYYTRTARYETFIREGICQLSQNPPTSCPQPTAPPIVDGPFGTPPLVATNATTLTPLEIVPVTEGSSQKGKNGGNSVRAPVHHSKKRKSSGKRRIQRRRLGS